MTVPLPEKRRCEDCHNLMTLNLFRLNCSTCRYCQDGITIPKRLLDSSKLDEKEITEDLSLNKDIKTIKNLEMNYSSYDLSDSDENLPQHE